MADLEDGVGGPGPDDLGRGGGDHRFASGSKPWASRRGRAPGARGAVAPLPYAAGRGPSWRWPCSSAASLGGDASSAATAISAARQTTGDAVSTPAIAGPAPSHAALASQASTEPAEPPIVTTEPPPPPTARAARLETTRPLAPTVVAPPRENAGPAALVIPATFTPTPVAAWLQPPAGPFSRSAAAVELAGLAARARACGVAEGPVTADVHVTFAPSGRATAASVSGALAGTPAGSCVTRVFRGASVPAFDGEAVTVHRTVALR